MNRRHELIIFDWDGTLMDSIAKIVRCFMAAMDDLALDRPSEAAARHVIGLGLSEALATLLPKADANTRNQVAERYRQHFLHHDQTDMPLFPGVREGLESLVEQGFRLAVATGKARRGLNRVLTDTGMADLFVATRTADESASKPNPQMLEDILELTGVDPAQALMVGDTTYDLQMAQNARMDSLAVSYGVHGRDQLLQHGPLVCVDSFQEVYAWLQKPNDPLFAAAMI